MTIVGSMAVSHAPGILGWRERADLQAADRFLAGCEELGQRLMSSNPDAVLIVTAEHFSNFFYSIPAFHLQIGDASYGPVEDYLGVDRREVRGDPNLAQTILEHCLENQVDMSFGQQLRLDHGTIVPLEILRLDTDLAVIPLIVNCLVAPFPTFERCRAVGGAIRDCLDSVTKRVALVAAGGLSHWPGMAEAGKVSEPWDRAVLSGLSAGRWDVLWNVPEDGAEDKGPGAEELRSWTVVGCAAHGPKAEVLSYEAVSAWSTGCAAVDLMPPSS